MSIITSTRGREMLSYLPWYYGGSRVMQAILQDEGAEFDKLRQALNETLNQYFVKTATWGLERWEQELALIPKSTDTDQQRRERILSHLRGFGTATIRLVKAVAETYEMGAIDVQEDQAAYSVTIRFVDKVGKPPNLDDILAGVRAVLPAHLALSYELKYFLWDDLDAMLMTWDDLDARQLTWDEFEVLSTTRQRTPIAGELALTFSEQ